MFYIFVQLLNVQYLILQKHMLLMIFCNEYVVTLNMHNNPVLKGYVKPDDLDIIDCITYNRHDYDMLLGSAGYEHSLNVI